MGDDLQPGNGISSIVRTIIGTHYSACPRRFVGVSARRSKSVVRPRAHDVLGAGQLGASMLLGESVHCYLDRVWNDLLVDCDELIWA